MKKLFTIGLIICFMAIQSLAQELKTHRYFDGQQQLDGLVSQNSGKALPGVLILPAWKGIDEEAKTAAINLSKEGYIAFVADIYGVGNVPSNNAEAAKSVMYYYQNHGAYQHRIALALDEMKKLGVNPSKIAVIGFCFGGGGALEAARGNLPVAGVVSIHGTLKKDPQRPNLKINTKILVEHPAADRSVSQADYDNLIKEMNEGQADWQIISYANCGHTFTNPSSAEYNAPMAKRAWNHTLLFLKEILRDN